MKQQNKNSCVRLKVKDLHMTRSTDTEGAFCWFGKQFYTK